MTGIIRCAGGRQAVVERKWEGKTVACLASGPSVTKEQVEILRAAREKDLIRVIVINDNYLIAPWADLLYFADKKWWAWHSQGIAKSWPWVSFTKEQVKEAFHSFKGQKVTIGNGGNEASDPQIPILKNLGPDGLSEDPSGIMTGSNSGFQSLNISVLSGAKRVLLVGYDMKYQGSRSHGHNGHPDKMPEEIYERYARRFKGTKKVLEKLGVEVLNCSSESSIEIYKKVRLEEVLQLDTTRAVVSEAGV